MDNIGDQYGLPRKPKEVNKYSVADAEHYRQLSQNRTAKKNKSSTWGKIHTVFDPDKTPNTSSFPGPEFRLQQIVLTDSDRRYLIDRVTQAAIYFATDYLRKQKNPTSDHYEMRTKIFKDTIIKANEIFPKLSIEPIELLGGRRTRRNRKSRKRLKRNYRKSRR